jgi:hypothetical protein
VIRGFHLFSTFDQGRSQCPSCALRSRIGILPPSRSAMAHKLPVQLLTKALNCEETGLLDLWYQGQQLDARGQQYHTDPLFLASVCLLTCKIGSRLK